MEQSFFSLVHPLEAKSINHGPHHLGNLVIAEVADASLVSVCHLLVRSELSSFNL